MNIPYAKTAMLESLSHPKTKKRADDEAKLITETIADNMKAGGFACSIPNCHILGIHVIELKEHGYSVELKTTTLTNFRTRIHTTIKWSRPKELRPCYT